MKNTSKNMFGVMQGRLLPKFKGRYQAHPIGYWQDEFFIAADLGLDCIEFILDHNDFEKNPLIYEDGYTEIKNLISSTGVKVRTICADYFMEEPLFSVDKYIVKKNLMILEKLYETSIRIGTQVIVLPCVDNSSLNSDEKVTNFVLNFKYFLKNLSKKSIKFALETDLEPNKFSNLLSMFESDLITVNYDIGNSASLGYNVEDELKFYGNNISDIHIKDRELGGGPVVLGKGNADFDSFFKILKKYKYTGPFIMQAYRDEEGIAIFKEQLEWIKLKVAESE